MTHSHLTIRQEIRYQAKQSRSLRNPWSFRGEVAKTEAELAKWDLALAECGHARQGLIDAQLRSDAEQREYAGRILRLRLEAMSSVARWKDRVGECESNLRFLLWTGFPRGFR